MRHGGQEVVRALTAKIEGIDEALGEHMARMDLGELETDTGVIVHLSSKRRRKVSSDKMETLSKDAKRILGDAATLSAWEDTPNIKTVEAAAKASNDDDVGAELLGCIVPTHSNASVWTEVLED